MKRIDSLRVFAVFFLAVLFLFFFAVCLRFGTRQILIERLHWNNAFTRLVTGGQEKSADAEADAAGPAASPVNWAAEYPFESSGEDTAPRVSALDRWSSLTRSVKGNVETYTGSLLPGQERFSAAARAYDRLIGFEGRATGSDRPVLTMKNGYLTYQEQRLTPAQTAEMADSVLSFSRKVEALGIPFVFVNAGSKVCPADPQLPAGTQEGSNANGDDLMAALAERGVPTLDLRAELMASGLDWYESFYATDHHWTTRTGLWAAGALAKYLSASCGFDFDPELFSLQNYEILLYDSWFLGSQGRIVGLGSAAPERFERLVPKFDTQFSLSIPSQGTEKSGDYPSVWLEGAAFDRIASYTPADYLSKPDAYHMITVRNNDLAHVKNLQPACNAGKKLLLIQDSFGWYSASFLAAGVEQTDILYPMSFDGSLPAYVKATRPDAVVLMYSEQNFTAPDPRKAHLTPFDLR